MLPLIWLRTTRSSIFHLPLLLAYDKLILLLWTYSQHQDESEDDEADQTFDGEITYDDPKSRSERERIIAQLADECSPRVNEQHRSLKHGDKRVQYDS